MPYWIIEYSINILSDFHVGEGVTLEGGNRHGLKLDETGLPYMPDTQVRGLIRLGAEKLKNWQPPLKSLFDANFGEPGLRHHNIWSYTSARFPFCFGVTGFSDANNLGLLTNQSHIKINPMDGVAENLFSYQKAGISDDSDYNFSKWYGKIYSVEPAEFRDVAFIIAAMRSEDRIGHRRSRGYGKVNWQPVSIKKYTEGKKGDSSQKIPVSLASVFDELDKLISNTRGTDL